ncbi:MAG: hypothetical protein ACOC2T_01765, partial [Planctomycetota bacterium]
MQGPCRTLPIAVVGVSGKNNFELCARTENDDCNATFLTVRSVIKVLTFPLDVVCFILGKGCPRAIVFIGWRGGEVTMAENMSGLSSAEQGTGRLWEVGVPLFLYAGSERNEPVDMYTLTVSPKMLFCNSQTPCQVGRGDEVTLQYGPSM